MDQYLPKKTDFSLLEIMDNKLYFIEESNDLELLLEKQKNPKIDCSFYVIDKRFKFKHKLTLHQSLDLKTINIQ